jgi:hypothetical protein
VLRAPSVIAACDDVVIDPSLTAGTGGRSWVSVVWNVEKTTNEGVEDSSDIVSMLNSYGPITSVPMRIPKAMLGKARYSVTLTVTNFLGQSSGAATAFTLDDNPNLPIVSILGSSVVTVLPSDTLTLFTSVTQASCAEASKAIGYKWTVSKNGVNQNMVSTSTNPTRFRLSPYTLTAQTVYTVTFRASVNETDNYPAIAATSSVTVQVVNGAIFAVVSGGYNRNFATQDPITLDASPFL